MSKWYIDKIKAAAPELLDGNTADYNGPLVKTTF